MRTVRSRAALVGGTALALLAAGATGAAAHVTVTPSTTAAGAYSVLTFAFGHGCGISPTTQLTIDIPEEVAGVTPTIHPNWEVEKVMETVDGAERVSEVVYTASTPVPNGLRDTLELSLQLPQEPGKLVFPVIQSCAEGETAWIQTYEEGESEPESPAPFVEVTDEASEESSDGAGPVGWVGVVLGALGLLAGGTALARTRRTS